MESCEDCKYFVSETEDGKCDIYGIPNHGVSICQDWKKKERGYL